MPPTVYIAVLALVAAAAAQQYEYETGPPARPAPQRIQTGFSGSAGPKPTPVPILKQINRHNEDGSYTYGYEGADGSFKIETKLPTGEVKGKYGYVDDVGKVRVVEYGATKYGFEPSGEGITVAPPTLVDETTNKDGTLNSQYGPDPYYDNLPAAPARQAPQPAPAPRPRPRPQPSSYDDYSESQDFGPAPQRGPPSPQRNSLPSSAPSANFDYVPQTRPPTKSFSPAPLRPSQSFSFSDPAPVDEQDNYAEPEPAPRPQPSKFTFAQPAPPQSRPSPPQFAGSFGPAPRSPPPPQFAPAPRPNPVTRQSGSGGGVLDQLAKDYALPQSGAAPLHDISFGYY